MMTFKCKMCGGDLRFAEGATTCECEFCGTMQTLPRLDNDRRANLYDRANHFRRQNEYDKAAGIFEQILQEDRTDAEAYWSLVLCRYGIEYVEDPATGRRVPTVNRAQFTSILADEDYKAALQYADGAQRAVYEAEAQQIDTIQKGILEISQREEPFDVFICYKETDENGRRTPDSVLANDLYHSLTREGFKVFFSRITLEDKLGQQYEPYIFAALNSARVMVVLGTKPEYFRAVWVKNEWSRYLSLIKAGQDKTLVPAYKDMDPYDLPEEFSHLQAQDMGKLGFMQDLIHGIRKLCAKDEARVDPQTAAQRQAAAEAAPLLKRGFIFLEDGDWEQASAYFDRVLDKDPENADAYVGHVLVTNQLRREEDLSGCKAPYEQSPNWQKAIRFAGEGRRRELEQHVADAKAARERARQEAVYQGAVSRFNNEAYEAALKEFRSIAKYRDSEEWIRLCEAQLAQLQAKKERERKARQYQAAQAMAARGDWANLIRAAEEFAKLGSFEHAQEEIARCHQRAAEVQKKALQEQRAALDEAVTAPEIRAIINELKKPIYKGVSDGLMAKADEKLQQALAREEEEARQKQMIRARQAQEARRKAQRAGKIALAAVAVLAAFLAVFLLVIRPNLEYQKGIELMKAGSLNEAEKVFTGLGGYRDSAERLRQINADRLFAKGRFEEAYEQYQALDAEYRTHAADYQLNLDNARAQMEAGDYDAALRTLSGARYVDGAQEMYNEALYRKAAARSAAGNYQEAVNLYGRLGSYQDSHNLGLQAKADRFWQQGDFASAADLYAQLGETYQTHAADYAEKYAAAEALLNAGSYDEAKEAFAALGVYSDASTKAAQAMPMKADALYAAGDYEAAAQVYESIHMDSKAAQARADALYAAGDYAGAQQLYGGLEAAYQTHAADYAALYEAARQQQEAGQYDEAAAAFTALGSYSDAAAQAQQSRYLKAAALAASGSYDDAIAIYTALGGYQDSRDLALKAMADQLYDGGSIAEAYDIYAGLAESYQTHKDDYAEKYAAAEALLKAGSYDEAHAAFAALGSYADAADQVKQTDYAKAAALRDSGDYDGAAAIYEAYNDTAGKAEAIYMKAEALRLNGSCDEAAAAFESLIDYQDSADKAKQAKADKLYADGDYAAAWDIYAGLAESYQTHKDDYAEKYQAAETARSTGDLDSAYDQFVALGGYSDAQEKAKQCGTEKAESLYSAGDYPAAAEVYRFIGNEEKANDALYQHAAKLANQGEYLQAAEQYTAILNYQDSRDQRYMLGLKARTEGRLAEAWAILSQDPDYRDAREAIYQTGVAASAEKLYEVSVPALTQVGQYKDAAMKLTMDTYAWGGQLYDQGEYDRSAEVFESMGDFSDTPERARAARYMAAQEALDAGRYDEASERFTVLGNYSDSAAQVNEAYYRKAGALLEAGEYSEAKGILSDMLGYKDSRDLYKECDYRPAKALFDAGQYSEAKELFSRILKYKDSGVLYKECDYRPAKTLFDAHDWEGAYKAILNAGIEGYEDSAEILNECRYQLGLAEMEKAAYDSAVAWFDAAGKYRDSADKAKECRYQAALALMAAGQYDEAIAAFRNIADYSDSQAQIAAAYDAKGAALEAAGSYADAWAMYERSGNEGKMQASAYQAAQGKMSSGEYDAAVSWYEKAGDYSDAKEQIVSIGEYYYMTQQYDQAEAVYAKASGTGVAAQRLYELGQYYELVGDIGRAAIAYKKAGVYQDAADKAKKMLARSWRMVGSIVEFGRYPQTAEDTDSTPIKWIVLAVDGNKALLISKCGLDAQPYNRESARITWDTCTLRTWLNGMFLNKAFTVQEQAVILLTNVDNSRSQCYSGWNTGGGKNTQDKVFLLSYAEANKYLGVTYENSNNTKSRVAPTAYAIKQGAYTSSSNKTADGTAAGWWWLRSPGGNQNFAAFVYIDGSLSDRDVRNDSGCVRPALWINLESDYFGN